MAATTLTYETLEGRFVTWAQACPDIRAAVVMGSRARTDHPADQRSDLDIIVFADHHESYMQRTDWVEQIAPVWISIPNRTSSGDLERLVMFEGGMNVDLVLVPNDLLRQAAQAGIIPEPYKRGARAILDKDGLAARIIPATFTRLSYPPPTKDEYAVTVNTFWYTAYYVAKQLRRGDLWMVKMRQGNLIELLVHMMEWHARATRGPNCDTWHMGRFMRDWADVRAVDAFEQVFAHFDAADSWRALFATLDLFRRLAVETSDKLGFPYPADDDAHVSSEIKGLFATSGMAQTAA